MLIRFKCWRVRRREEAIERQWEREKPAGATHGDYCNWRVRRGF